MKHIPNTWQGVDLEIPEGVTKIRPYAYHNGEDLRSIKIPASVTEIGEGAFDGCINLEEISVHAENQYYADGGIGALYSKNETRLIRVPENYFPNDDPTKDPMVRWRGHGHLLFSNWLNYFVYQTTPYDIKTIGNE